MPKTNLSWSELAFASKKQVNQLEATFIAAPRHISSKRFRLLLQQYLPKGNLVVGIAQEPYILGFEGQPQFRAFELDTIAAAADLVNKQSGSSHKIYTLQYAQTDLVHILQKLDFKRVVLINGSWKYSFHTREAYYALATRKVEYELVSPFTDADEAAEYARTVQPLIQDAHPLPVPDAVLSAAEMLQAAGTAAAYSFDYNFQTGVSLGRAVGTSKSTDRYRFLTAAFNKVVPYQTYAMYHGAAREKHFSPPHDLNHYDTVHAEVELLITALQDGIDLAGTTVFINLLPCPTCSRMLADTPIKELVYQVDHSEGYAVAMLEAAGKKVRRIVPVA